MLDLGEGVKGTIKGSELALIFIEKSGIYNFFSNRLQRRFPPTSTKILRTTLVIIFRDAVSQNSNNMENGPDKATKKNQ